MMLRQLWKVSPCVAQQLRYAHKSSACRLYNATGTGCFVRLPGMSRGFATETPQQPGKQSSNTGKYVVVGLLVAVGSAVVAKKTGLISFGGGKECPKKKLEQKVKRLPPYATPDSQIPEKVTYLLIGAGTAGFSAFRAIKVEDATAEALIIGEEEYYPYMRPPLSKELWFADVTYDGDGVRYKQWNGKERLLAYEPGAFFIPPAQLSNEERGGIAFVRGRKVVHLEAEKSEAVLENGRRIKYEKCLLAPGGSPKNLDVFKDLDEEVSVFRNIEDFRHLAEKIQMAKNILIVGGGFLGSELACSLAHRVKDKGAKVVQVFPESGNIGLVLPEYLSTWTTEKMKGLGVKVMPEVTVKEAKREKGGGLSVKLSNGEQLAADHVIVAVGLHPRTDLAESAGLETDEETGGYLVNSELQARSNIWVAGDAACFYDVKLGRRRVEHHDHAVVSGRLAGENMTGAGKRYWHQSMFWSDLGPDVGFEAIGLVDSKLPTVGVFAKATLKDTPRAVVEETGEGVRSETEAKAVKKENKSGAVAAPVLNTPKDDGDYSKGVVFYLKNDKIVGILLWNVYNCMTIARKVLRESRSIKDIDEVSKLFDLHQDDDLEDES